MHESLLLNVGLPTPEGSYHNANSYMEIQVKNEIIIYSFTIDQNFIGNLTIYFNNKTTGEIKRKTVNIQSTGVQDIILNVELKPGRYYIGRDDAQNTPLKRTPYNVQFPFTNNDITLIGGTPNTVYVKWYYYWFNIKYYRKKILHYDFQECGEPTTNLLSTDSQIFENSVGSWSQTRQSISISNEWYEIGHNSLKIQNTNGDFSAATGYYVAYQIHNHMLNNIKYTMSMTVYNPNQYDLIVATANLTSGLLDSNGDIQIDKHKIKSRSKKRIWFTVMFSDVETIGYHLRLGIQEGQPVGSIFYIDAVQFEKKDHQTPFVIGSREGKILDKSGYNFHQTVQEQTSPIWQKSVINNYQYKFNNKPLDGQTFQHFKTNLFIPKTFSFGQWIRGSTQEQPLDNIYPFGWQNLCTMGPSGGTNDNRSGIIYYYDASNHTSWNPGSRSLYNGKWHHWFITYDGNTGQLKQYIDGQLDQETIRTNLYHLETVRPFNVGSQWATNYGGHGGNITDVRVYQTQLTDQEIKEIYNKTKKTKVEEKRNVINTIKKPVSNLVLYYKFDEFVESTENLFPRDQNQLAFTNAYNGSNYGFGSQTNIQQQLDNSLRIDQRSQVTKVSRINSDISQRTYVYIGLSSPLNSTRVISFWYYGTYGNQINPYNNDQCANLYYLDQNGNWVGGNTSITIPVQKNVWQKIIIKIVNKGTQQGTGWSWLVLHSDTATATLQNTEYWQFTLFQYEEKDHQTPYTPSIRNGYIKDYSGNNNYGRIYLGSSPKYIEQEKQYEFDGIKNKIITKNPLNFDNGNLFTIQLWIYQKDGNGMIFSPNSYGVDHFIRSNSFNNNLIVNVTEGGDLNVRSISTNSNTFPVNEWHHLQLIIEGLNIKIYVDGLLDKEQTEIIPIQPWTGDIYIGCRQNNTYFYNGKLKDIRIYNKQLSENQIKQLYNQTKWS